MGLTIKLLHVIKHDCNVENEETTDIYVHKNCKIYINKDSGDDLSYFLPLKIKKKRCLCDSTTADMFYVRVGYKSIHDGQFNPGDTVEIIEETSFYFGSYLKWATYVTNN